MAHLNDPIMAIEDRQGDLTFGVEIEFLTPVIEGSNEDPHPADPRQVFRVSKCDSNNYFWIHDLSCFILKDLQKIPDLTVEGEGEDEYVAPHDNVQVYDHWRLIRDSSVQISTKPGSPGSRFPAYHWDGKEVTSEVLSSTDPDNVRKITEVCRAIRSHRVHLNENTSVHIHVGCGDDGFTLTTVKKVITLLWFADAKLFDLHHPSRLGNLYCRPISEYSRLTEVDHTGILGTVDPEGLDQMAQHFPEIMETMDEGAYRSKYIQLKQMWGSDETFHAPGRTGGNTNTFEFRHMAGSLDPEHILHWAHVCIGIVDFARNTDAPAFREQVSKFLHPPPGYGGVEVLEDLGLAEEAQFFRSKVDSYKREDFKTFKDGDKDVFFVPPM
ncbi:hypothetical protein PG994_005674 [Apiospora phragmitis]|uniref:Amidoligase enzyme n=1 Tax=Apiospora phragmitis TaxID=2905665 RepID=A0ABR1VCW8_9PEZI